MAGLIRIKLDKYLKQVGKTRYWVAKNTGMDFQTIDKYYKNKVVRYDSYILARICDCLACDISDIIEYIPNNK